MRLEVDLDESRQSRRRRFSEEDDGILQVDSNFGRSISNLATRLVARYDHGRAAEG